MYKILERLTRDIKFTGDIVTDTTNLQTAHDHLNVAEHCMRVAGEAQQLARKFGADTEKARLAGLLHDISDIIPLSKAVNAAREFGLNVLPEEIHCPMILHQRLSVVVARELFNITDDEILGAIECHTTLKANATLLEKIVFISDKIQWDQPGENPYLSGIRENLDKSLDAAVFYFINCLWLDRENLMVIHPWLVDAFKELSCQFLDTA